MSNQFADMSFNAPVNNAPANAPVLAPANVVRRGNQTYIPSIGSYADAARAKQQLFATKNAPGTSRTGIPRTNADRARLVLVIMEALFDTTYTLESPETKPYKDMVNQRRITNEAAEVVSWDMLVRQEANYNPI